MSALETDLYAPVRDWLTEQGYTVRGEVRNCDIAAAKDGELVVIELKRSLNLALLAQAAVRQRTTDSVYVAIPRPSNRRRWLGQSKAVLHLIRRLELGLILVSTDRRKPAVEVVLHPLPFVRQRRKSSHRAVLREIERRSGDFNEGGSSRRKLVTACRENAIHIAACLAEIGPLAPRVLRSLGTGDKTLSILRSNFYGWFERVDRGVYALTAKGRSELDSYEGLARRYRQAANTASACLAPRPN